MHRIAVCFVFSTDAPHRRYARDDRDVFGALLCRAVGIFIFARSYFAQHLNRLRACVFRLGVGGAEVRRAMLPLRNYAAYWLPNRS